MPTLMLLKDGKSFQGRIKPMTTCKLTEEDKKLLTGEELLDEYWHEFTIGGGKLSECSCGLKGHIVRDSCSNANRTFLTPDDMYAVRAALREKGLWEKFYYFASLHYAQENSIGWLSLDDGEVMAFLDTDIERFHWLVAQFMKERE
jgi:hypothetical protein